MSQRWQDLEPKVGLVSSRNSACRETVPWSNAMSQSFSQEVEEAISTATAVLWWFWASQRHFSPSLSSQSTLSYHAHRPSYHLRPQCGMPWHSSYLQETHSWMRERWRGPLGESVEKILYPRDALSVLILYRRLSLRDKMHEAIDWSCRATRVDSREWDLESRKTSHWKDSRVVILVSVKTQFSHPYRRIKDI